MQTSSACYCIFTFMCGIVTLNGISRLKTHLHMFRVIEKQFLRFTLTCFPSCRQNGFNLLGPGAFKHINIRPGSCTDLHELWASCSGALASFGSRKETLPLRDKWATSVEVRPHTSDTQQWNSQALFLLEKHSSSYHLDEEARYSISNYLNTSTHSSNYRFHLVVC